MFQKTLKDFTLSGWLTTLSFNSLKEVESSFLMGIEEAFSEAPEQVFTQNIETFSFQVYPVQPSQDKVKIVAVDVACRKVGVTSEGVLCAIRGALVWRAEEKYHYTKYGPFLFYLNPSKFFGDGEALPANFLSPTSPLGLTARMQMLIERELQLQACQTFKDAIILFDGNLSVMGDGWSSERLKRALAYARANRNRVIAFSKETRLLQEGGFLKELVENRVKPPCLIHLLLEGPSGLNLRNYGRIFLAKLSRQGYCFRLDVDLKLSLEEAVNSVCQLVSSDLLVQGYPETLRLAHMLSTLTPLDILGIQRFLSKNYGVRFQRSRSLKRMLFGPYSGEEA